ncbi:hypothetical protein, variant [Fonticula alba]|nr:hypothetical protein, variant [Fonticula alba]KCV68201.1 hypothetical protein, variant [Fonticula alba]|eukprot:XP_009497255.1 hypothetical protein, variant [Fonticula alba]
MLQALPPLAPGQLRDPAGQPVGTAPLPPLDLAGQLVPLTASLLQAATLPSTPAAERRALLHAGVQLAGEICLRMGWAQPNMPGFQLATLLRGVPVPSVTSTPPSAGCHSEVIVNFLLSILLFVRPTAPVGPSTTALEPMPGLSAEQVADLTRDLAALRRPTSHLMPMVGTVAALRLARDRSLALLAAVCQSNRLALAPASTPAAPAWLLDDAELLPPLLVAAILLEHPVARQTLIHVGPAHDRTSGQVSAAVSSLVAQTRGVESFALPSAGQPGQRVLRALCALVLGRPGTVPGLPPAFTHRVMLFLQKRYKLTPDADASSSFAGAGIDRAAIDAACVVLLGHPLDADVIPGSQAIPPTLGTGLTSRQSQVHASAALLALSNMLEFAAHTARREMRALSRRRREESLSRAEVAALGEGIYARLVVDFSAPLALWLVRLATSAFVPLPLKQMALKTLDFVSKYIPDTLLEQPVILWHLMVYLAQLDHGLFQRSNPASPPGDVEMAAPAGEESAPQPSAPAPVELGVGDQNILSSQLAGSVDTLRASVSGHVARSLGRHQDSADSRLVWPPLRQIRQLQHLARLAAGLVILGPGHPLIGGLLLDDQAVGRYFGPLPGELAAASQPDARTVGLPADHESRAFGAAIKLAIDPLCANVPPGLSDKIAPLAIGDSMVPAMDQLPDFWCGSLLRLYAAIYARPLARRPEVIDTCEAGLSISMPLDAAELPRLVDHLAEFLDAPDERALLLVRSLRARFCLAVQAAGAAAEEEAAASVVEPGSPSASAPAPASAPGQTGSANALSLTLQDAILPPLLPSGQVAGLSALVGRVDLGPAANRFLGHLLELVARLDALVEAGQLAAAQDTEAGPFAVVARALCDMVSIFGPRSAALDTMSLERCADSLVRYALQSRDMAVRGTVAQAAGSLAVYLPGSVLYLDSARALDEYAQKVGDGRALPSTQGYVHLSLLQSYFAMLGRMMADPKSGQLAGLGGSDLAQAVDLALRACLHILRLPRSYPLIKATACQLAAAIGDVLHRLDLAEDFAGPLADIGRELIALATAQPDTIDSRLQLLSVQCLARVALSLHADGPSGANLLQAAISALLPSPDRSLDLSAACARAWAGILVPDAPVADAGRRREHFDALLSAISAMTDPSAMGFSHEKAASAAAGLALTGAALTASLWRARPDAMASLCRQSSSAALASVFSPSALERFCHLLVAVVRNYGGASSVCAVYALCGLRELVANLQGTEPFGAMLLTLDSAMRSVYTILGGQTGGVPVSGVLRAAGRRAAGARDAQTGAGALSVLLGSTAAAGMGPPPASFLAMRAVCLFLVQEHGMTHFEPVLGRLLLGAIAGGCAGSDTLQLAVPVDSSGNQLLQGAVIGALAACHPCRPGPPGSGEMDSMALVPLFVLCHTRPPSVSYGFDRTVRQLFANQGRDNPLAALLPGLSELLGQMNDPSGPGAGDLPDTGAGSEDPPAPREDIGSVARALWASIMKALTPGEGVTAWAPDAVAALRRRTVAAVMHQALRLIDIYSRGSLADGQWQVAALRTLRSALSDRSGLQRNIPLFPPGFGPPLPSSAELRVFFVDHHHQQQPQQQPQSQQPPVALGSLSTRLADEALLSLLSSAASLCDGPHAVEAESLVSTTLQFCHRDILLTRAPADAPEACDISEEQRLSLSRVAVLGAVQILAISDLCPQSARGQCHIFLSKVYAPFAPEGQMHEALVGRLGDLLLELAPAICGGLLNSMSAMETPLATFAAFHAGRPGTDEYSLYNEAGSGSGLGGAPGSPSGGGAHTARASAPAPSRDPSGALFGDMLSGLLSEDLSAERLLDQRLKAVGSSTAMQAAQVCAVAILGSFSDDPQRRGVVREWVASLGEIVRGGIGVPARCGASQLIANICLKYPALLGPHVPALMKPLSAVALARASPGASYVGSLTTEQAAIRRSMGVALALCASLLHQPALRPIPAGESSPARVMWSLARHIRRVYLSSFDIPAEPGAAAAAAAAATAGQQAPEEVAERDPSPAAACALFCRDLMRFGRQAVMRLLVGGRETFAGRGEPASEADSAEAVFLSTVFLGAHEGGHVGHLWRGIWDDAVGALLNGGSARRLAPGLYRTISALGPVRSWTARQTLVRALTSLSQSLGMGGAPASASMPLETGLPAKELARHVIPMLVGILTSGSPSPAGAASAPGIAQAWWPGRPQALDLLGRSLEYLCRSGATSPEDELTVPLRSGVELFASELAQRFPLVDVSRLAGVHWSGPAAQQTGPLVAGLLHVLRGLGHLQAESLRGELAALALGPTLATCVHLIGPVAESGQLGRPASAQQHGARSTPAVLILSEALQVCAHALNLLGPSAEMAAIEPSELAALRWVVRTILASCHFPVAVVTAMASGDSPDASGDLPRQALPGSHWPLSVHTAALGLATAMLGAGLDCPEAVESALGAIDSHHSHRPLTLILHLSAWLLIEAANRRGVLVESDLARLRVALSKTPRQAPGASGPAHAPLPVIELARIQEDLRARLSASEDAEMRPADTL